MLNALGSSERAGSEYGEGFVQVRATLFKVQGQARPNSPLG